MHALRTMLAATAIALVGFAAQAQDAVTATCKDGSTYSSARRSGACRGHGGVASFGTDTAPAATLAPTQPSTAAPAAIPQPRTATTAPMPLPRASTNASAGGPGQVWVNSGTKVYHCQGDRYYGNTKKGTYMSEAKAVAAGNRPDRAKSCS